MSEDGGQRAEGRIMNRKGAKSAKKGYFSSGGWNVGEKGFRPV